MSSTIKVYGRLRPHQPADGMYSDDNIRIQGSKIVVNNQSRNNQHEFSLNGCFGPEADQNEVFDCVQPLLNEVFSGQNATIFAYGVTGSGKTMTMQGNIQAPGIMPRVAGAMIDRSGSAGAEETVVTMSYIEILKDELFDLLSGREEDGAGTKLDIRRDENGNNIIVNLSEQVIADYDSFRKLYNQASRLRKTAATKLNSHSSRSHAILTFNLKVYGPGCMIRESRMRLCDLAGSENNNLTGNDTERLRESSAINKSLTVLGYTIEAINRNAAMIPYRDSKLTRVLADALGGTSSGMMICCLAPGEKHVKETINSLGFATRAKKVVTGIIPPPPPVPATYQDRRISGVNGCTVLSNIPANQNHKAARYTQADQLLKPWLGAKTRPQRLNQSDVSGRNTVVAHPAGVSEARVKELFEEWYTARKAEEEEEAKATLIASKAANPADAGSDPRPCLREPPRPVSSAEIASLAEDEQEKRGQMLINLGRKYEQVDDKVRALDCYSHARLYLPGKSKLLNRITELQVYLEGEGNHTAISAFASRLHGDPDIHNSGIKRSRGYRGDSLASLAQETEDIDMLHDEEGVERRVKGRYGEVSEHQHIIASVAVRAKLPTFFARP